jgi:thiol-disulfide isomerase/thioredoxin
LAVYFIFFSTKKITNMKLHHRLVLMLLMACATLYSFAQNNPINQLSKDANGQPMLLGQCERTALQQAPFSSWFSSNYDTYIVDSFTCTFIKPLLANKTITLFLGTWCGDSKREVPRILKMMDCCGFPADQLKLIMVSNAPDAYKQSPQHEEAGKNIIRVPTLLIYENQKEVGRIVEYPVASLEKDMLAILQQKGYVPHYAAPTIGRK